MPADPDAPPLEGAEREKAITSARNSCLWYLERSAKTRAQLAEKLHNRGTPADIAGEVLDRLEEVGLINDRAYAETFARGRHEFQRMGAYAIVRQLTMKGVARDLAEEVVGELVTDESAHDAAHAEAAKRARTTRGEPRDRVRKIAAALGRKGHPPGLCWEAAKAAVYVDDDDDDDVPPDDVLYG